MGDSLRRRYGGYCAYAVSKGKLVTVDPDVYVVLDEKLFLFSNAEARTAFENEEPGIVQVADGKWTEMESERLCGNQNFTARSTRRLLDGVAMPFPHTSGFHAGERAQKKGCFSCF